MNIKLLWMYNDVMDLYGDKGNIASLEYRSKSRGIDFIIDKATIGDEVDFVDYDIVLIGGGADREQRLLADDLIKRKSKIEKAISEGTFFCLICGSYQLFGQYYIDAKGNKIEGLGICEYYTEPSGSSARCIGNIIIDAIMDSKKIRIVGFENHGGQTQGVEHPLGKVLLGNGNSFNCGCEGYYNNNILGTYIHGPLLPKNSELTDFIILKILNKKYGIDKLDSLDDFFEIMANETMIKRYLNKNEKLD